MVRKRMLFVDNIRLALIALVVCHHVVMTYFPIAGWYYRDPVPAGPLTKFLFLLFLGFNQSFFMGALFALAGYFAAMSLRKKGSASFAAGRLFRLGLPTAVYMVAINPATICLGYAAEIQAKGGPELFLAHYFSGLGVWSGSGPMWFALALLIFSLVYAAGYALKRPVPEVRESRPVTAGLLTWLALLCAAGAFALRLFFPMGKTVLGMQIGNFVQYVLLFGFGVAAYANDWLRSLDARFGRRCLLVAGCALVAWAVLILATDRTSLAFCRGGLHWQSLYYALWESVSGVCMTVGLIVLFRERWNRQNRCVAALSDSAFAVYVLHPPVLVALALALTPLAAPALAKVLLLCALGLPACFAVGWLVRRVPVLRELVRQ